MSLIVNLIPTEDTYLSDFGTRLRTQLLELAATLTTTDLVSRHVSGLGNPRVRANTTSDWSLDVEARVRGGEWVALLTVTVR